MEEPSKHPTSEESDNEESPVPPDYNDGQCDICMNPHADTKSYLDCGHVFCFECLKTSSRVKLECPKCKRPFTSFKWNDTESPDEFHTYTPEVPEVTASGDGETAAFMRMDYMGIANELVWGNATLLLNRRRNGNADEYEDINVALALQMISETQPNTNESNNEWDDD